MLDIDQSRENSNWILREEHCSLCYVPVFIQILIIFLTGYIVYFQWQLWKEVGIVLQIKYRLLIFL